MAVCFVCCVPVFRYMCARCSWAVIVCVFIVCLFVPGVCFVFSVMFTVWCFVICVLRFADFVCCVFIVACCLFFADCCLFCCFCLFVDVDCVSLLIVCVVCCLLFVGYRLPFVCSFFVCC